MKKRIQREKMATKKKELSNAVIILLLAIIILSSVIGMYAWAKYTSSTNGEAEAQVAKWHFDIRNANGESASTGNIDFPITRTDKNTTVVEGNLAPRNIWKI